MTKKIGIVAGSFDPITEGHLWLIRQAIEMVDELHVVVGTNPTKTCYFTAYEREHQVLEILIDELPSCDFHRTRVVQHQGLLVDYAMQIGADYIIRGIRNSADFLYEQQVQAVNARITAQTSTVYFIPPSEYLEVSSSTVRGLVGFNGWKNIVGEYVHPVIVNAFSHKMGDV